MRISDVERNVLLIVAFSYVCWGRNMGVMCRIGVSIIVVFVIGLLIVVVIFSFEVRFFLIFKFFFFLVTEPSSW